jgi:hypothetical protein
MEGQKGRGEGGQNVEQGKGNPAAAYVIEKTKNIG